MKQKTKFYHFSQNNSGGSFVIDEADGISETVLIEAVDADHANNRAEIIGLYFNGCETGIDCPCCGDRWYPVDESDGTNKPSIYGVPVSRAKKSYFRTSCFIHYISGKVKKVKLKDEK